MSGQSLPFPQAHSPVLDISSIPQSSSPSFWDRLSTWASENKAVVYTIAGVAVVVTGAGVVYYLSDSGKDSKTGAEEKRRASKKERRKAKKEQEKEQTQSEKETAPTTRELPGKSIHFAQ